MSSKSSNPFRALDKRQFPKSRRERRRLRLAMEQSGTTDPTPLAEPGEAELFEQAMADVQPIKAGGRAVAPPPEASAPAADGPPTDEDDAVRSRLMDLVSGRVEFSLEHSEEFVQGCVKGLDTKVACRLKAGALSPEAHLDLHGMTVEQAYDALSDFVREQYLNTSRCLLIITGRGRNSPSGQGVLRQAVQSWLTRDPFKRVVLAFCTALPRHGGAGALYVLLRKRRKAGGKIVWNREPLDDIEGDF